eukprot:TRINITY_DN44481_c0_g1_i1.p1 TRINITY_DN44481_c0_g1~~TRINITY_DN44481_c0_g1_i1.p1  ORF type:complete len:258 (+),score=41.38 TRINITY_DN44481_c0_g1_i1:34-774(+)
MPPVESSESEDECATAIQLELSEPRDFTIDCWEPVCQMYGILHMLSVRESMPSDTPKPSDLAHLKFLRSSSAVKESDERRSGTGPLHSDPRQSRDETQTTVEVEPDPGNEQVLRRDQTHATVEAEPDPGNEQDIPAPVFQRKRWRVSFDSGLGWADVLVREMPDLSSREVAVLRKGDPVEQTGPAVWLSALPRMPVITLSRGALDNGPANSKVVTPVGLKGWVTLDASAVDGPVFFEADEPAFIYQ